MKYIHINDETLTKLQTFQSVEEMNESIKAHKQAHELSQTDRDILDAISRYACKYKGVCYLSKQKLAEDAGYKSRRTAIRACKQLEALGIIKQYETRREGGDRRRSVNVITIYKYVFSTENQQIEISSRDTAESHGQETPSKTINHNTYKETEEQTSERASQPIDYIKAGLKNAIPAPIYDALAPFFDGQTLYNTYGILLRAKARIDRTITLEEYHSEYIDVFMNVIRLKKAGRVRKLSGYLYVAWERLSAQISRQKALYDSDKCDISELLAFNPYRAE